MPCYPCLRAVVPAAVALAAALTPATLSAQSQGAGGMVVCHACRQSTVRTVRFRTSEGTWMSLDVSPDGATVVFDLLGDLYTMPIAGGHATPITSGPGFDEQPRFSPDGRTIAFRSDRDGVPNIWLLDRPGNTVRQLTHLPDLIVDGDNHIASPAWSPDGRTIVVSQTLGSLGQAMLSAKDLGHASRWLLAAYDVASGAMRWVSDTAASAARPAIGAAFGPDKHFVYAAVEHNRAEWSPLAFWHIARVDLDGGRITPEMSPWVARAGMRPTVSRDGRLLAYVSASGSRNGLRLRDLATHQERWLVLDSIDLGNFWGAEMRDVAPGFAFTPDAKAVIIAFAGKIHRIEVATGKAAVTPFVVNVARDVVQPVVHQFVLPDTAVRTRAVMQPALSPDGGMVAFSARSRIWVMDLPRAGGLPGAPRRLTADSLGEFYPSWLPDGRWIVYSAWRDGDGGAVRRARVPLAPDDVPGRSVRLTSDTALYFNTAVTPDGRRVAAVRAPMAPERLLTHSASGRSDTLTAVWVPVGGGAPTTVASLSFASPRLDVTADLALAMSRRPVEQLYFTDGHRLRVGLMSVGWTGEDWRTHLVVSDRFTDIRALNDVTGVLSPDGRRALLTHVYTLSQVTLPQGRGAGTDTMNVETAQSRRFDDPAGAADRWGRALAPWISWSRDGRRVLFVQGGSLFVGDVPERGWARFDRVDVPLKVPVDTPSGTVVLRGARLITMRGPRGSVEVIPRGDVVVRNHRIAGVGATGSVAVPVGATVLDLTGKTILPGYVDIHDHIGYAHGVHAPQPWGLLVRLAHGVTASRDPFAPQMDYNDIFAYRERERAGEMISPRIFGTGIVHNRSDRPLRTIEDALDVVRPTAEYFGAETFKEYTAASWQAHQLIARAAAEAGLNATIHGDALRSAINGFSGAEHATNLPFYDDVATLQARSGIVQTLTAGVIVGGFGRVLSTGREPWDFPRMYRFTPPSERSRWTEAWASGTDLFGHPDKDVLGQLMANAARVVRRGGNIGMGMHGNVPGMGIHYEMWLHALGGMPNHEILRSATIVGATAIGHAGDFGSLESGKLADVQVLDQNPLEDIRHTNTVRYVMKNGRMYRASDLSQMWPDREPLSPIYLFQREQNIPVRR